MAIRDRVKEFRRIPASEIKPNPKNWRTHPEQQSAALTAMLEDVGFAGAVLVRETSDGYELIDGHLRLDVMDGESVPAIVLDVNEQEADKLLATIDPLGAMAGADEGVLFKLLKESGLENSLISLIDLGSGIEEVFPPDLSSDLKPLREMTFILSDNQASVVQEAISAAKKNGVEADQENDNVNGAALAAIAKAFL